MDSIATVVTPHARSHSAMAWRSHELAPNRRTLAGKPPSPAGVSADEHEADPESFVPLVRACLQALFMPIDYACELFDRRALAKDLDRVYRRAVAVMGV